MAQQMRENLTAKKNQRNCVQIEKDLIHDFYGNTKAEIGETAAQIRNFDARMQREEESHSA